MGVSTSEVIELMKKPEERSKKVKELAKRFLLEEGKILDVREAAQSLIRMFQVGSGRL